MLENAKDCTNNIKRQGVGTGNDFYGWEFYKDVKVDKFKIRNQEKFLLPKAAWGSVETPEWTWENPAPSKMYWRPDKVMQ